MLLEASMAGLEEILELRSTTGADVCVVEHAANIVMTIPRQTKRFLFMLITIISTTVALTRTSREKFITTGQAWRWTLSVQFCVAFRITPCLGAKEQNGIVPVFHLSTHTGRYEQ